MVFILKERVRKSVKCNIIIEDTKSAAQPLELRKMSSPFLMLTIKNG